MMVNGKVFKIGSVDEWMDCGNKDVIVEINLRMLGFLYNDGEYLVDYNVILENFIIILFCYIGENVVLKNIIVGLNVFLGKGICVENSVIKNSLV